ncbi:hypothetical protein TWF718_001792 [Orbilia javanica]|uniref:Uncharacterized protein n=1 Tax=Orbilia javanica TaxID=47235 RepID=A0AAN8N950_9PEZI
MWIGECNIWYEAAHLKGSKHTTPTHIKEQKHPSTAASRFQKVTSSKLSQTSIFHPVLNPKPDSIVHLRSSTRNILSLLNPSPPPLLQAVSGKMQPNNHDDDAHQDIDSDVDIVDADSDGDIIIFDASTLSRESAPEFIDQITVSLLPHTRTLPQANLLDHHPNLLTSSPPSSAISIKRPASSVLEPLSVLGAIASKRHCLDLIPSNKTIDPRLFGIKEEPLFDSDPDFMDIDFINFEPNTREYRRFLLRYFPPRSRGLLERDSDYRISEEDRQLLRVLEYSKMYPQKKLLLTDTDKEEAKEMAAAYNESLVDANVPESVKGKLRKKSKEKFELQMSWDKITTQLQNIQLGRHSRMEWTELGLPPSELVKPQSSMSASDIKVVACVKTKVPEEEEDIKHEEIYEGKGSQVPHRLTDPKKTIFFQTKEPHISGFSAGASRTDPTAAQGHAEKQEGTIVQQMLELRSKYKITPLAPEYPNPGEKEGRLFTYERLRRYNKKFCKDTENSCGKEKEIRENIRRTEAEYLEESFFKRQNSIWYTPLPAKKNSWEKIPEYEHPYYTFCLQEICDAAPERRVILIEHNKFVEASGQRKGDFPYERDDPFGKDTYLDDNPLIIEGDDLEKYL